MVLWNEVLVKINEAITLIEEKTTKDSFEGVALQMLIRWKDVIQSGGEISSTECKESMLRYHASRDIEDVYPDVAKILIEIAEIIEGA